MKVRIKDILQVRTGRKGHHVSQAERDRKSKAMVTHWDKKKKEQAYQKNYRETHKEQIREAQRKWRMRQKVKQ